MFKMRFIVVALTLMGVFASPHKTKSEFRLPTNFKPISYRLDITTHLEDQFTFEGKVDIKIACEHATHTVVLHADKLDINTKRVTIVGAGRKEVPVIDVSFAPAKELMYVKTSENLKTGNEYVLSIPFAGNITDDLVGYYRSSYHDKKTNQTKWLAVTQFEPADARRAFPCFDEPAMKAKFKISLGHKRSLKSVSNMNLIKTSTNPTNPHYVIDEYEDSVPMSTYLVAYMVSDFASIKSDTRDGEVKFRIIARKDAIDQTELARKTGPMVLKYYEDYFDEKFPISKQDMVALPDFSSGAMENWGLVTYRESALLIDPKEATIDNVYYAVEVIAHELAHNWFGNLVTMKWWTDLWLNEGFATYVASRAVDILHPKWNSFRVETTENFIRVMDLDSLHSSHPVSVAVGHPDEIAQIFDTISYMKGSYLLHMMNTFLGEDTFKQGIRNYIHKYRYSNAEQDDLWRELTEEAHRVGSLDKKITLKEIMDTWTLQTGFPVLIVTRNYSTGIVSLSQERFLSIKSNETKDNNCWWIPLTMTTASVANFKDTRAKTWLNCKNKNNFTMFVNKTETWVIFNLQISGLYRVMYDERNWQAIVNTLNDPNKYKQIHTLNRVQLIEDALSFSLLGDLDYETAFYLLQYLRHETEYTPWFAALSGFGPISIMMKRTEDHGVYKAFIRRLLAPVYRDFQDMSVELKEFEDIRFKNLVTAHACQNNINNCTERVEKLYRNWMNSPDPDRKFTLPKELKQTISCQAIRLGGKEEWEFLWKRYERSNIATEKSKYLWALGCATKKSLLIRYLNWTIGENAIIRKQDAILVFYSVAYNDMGFYVAKDFLYRRIKEISEYFQPRGDRVGSYVEAIGTQMKTHLELDEFQSFLARSSMYLKGAEMAVSQTIESIKINIAWKTKFYQKVVDLMIDIVFGRFC